MNELDFEWRANGGVARIHRFSHLRGQADRAVAAGKAVRILPGVVSPTSVASDPRVRIKAVHMWHRDAVLIGKAALVMQGLKPPGQHLHDLDAVKEVEAYSRTRSIEREGIRVHRWRVPPSVRDGEIWHVGRGARGVSAPPGTRRGLGVGLRSTPAGVGEPGVVSSLAIQFVLAIQPTPDQFCPRRHQPQILVNSGTGIRTADASCRHHRRETKSGRASLRPSIHPRQGLRDREGRGRD